MYDPEEIADTHYTGPFGVTLNYHETHPLARTLGMGIDDHGNQIRLYFYVEPSAVKALASERFNTSLPHLRNKQIPVGHYVRERAIDNLDTTKLWMAGCEDKHKCLQNDRNSLPLRLLAIQNSDSQVLLFDTKNLYESHYTALSYCWAVDPM